MFTGSTRSGSFVQGVKSFKDAGDSPGISTRRIPACEMLVPKTAALVQSHPRLLIYVGGGVPETGHVTSPAAASAAASIGPSGRPWRASSWCAPFYTYVFYCCCWCYAFYCCICVIVASLLCLFVCLFASSRRAPWPSSRRPASSGGSLGRRGRRPAR